MGSNPVLFEDLGNTGDILRGIKTLLDANEKFGKSAEQINERIRASQEKTIEQLRDFKDKITALNIAQKARQTQLKQEASEADKLVRVAKEHAELLARNKAIYDSNTASVNSLKSRMADLKKEYDGLSGAEEKDLARKKAIEAETRALNTVLGEQVLATKRATTATNTAIGSYDRLEQQTKQLWAELKKMPNALDASTGALNKNNKAAVAHYSQIQKNEQALREFNQGLGKHQGNVGNYSSVLQNAGRSALGFTAAVVGMDSALTAIQKATGLALQIESMDSALRVVSLDTDDFNRKQAFLTKTSNDLGIEFDKLEENYVTLSANAKGTALQGKLADDIFKSMSVTGARLKLSNEKLEKGFLAISQMIGKTTVQSEELKGQLSEAIPGASQIMARALGVSTAKLGEMMKAGEVLAVDALPKFAAELERTFNPSHEKRIDGVRANLARLKNEGIEWVRQFRVGEVMDSMATSALNFASTLRTALSPAIKTTVDAFSEQNEKVEDLMNRIPELLKRHDELAFRTNLTAKETDELKRITNQLSEIVPNATYQFDQYGNSLGINRSAVIAFAEAQRELNSALNADALKAQGEAAALALKRIKATRDVLNNKQENVTLSGGGSGLSGAGGQTVTMSLTPQRTAELQKQLKKEGEIINSSAKQIIALGGKLNDEIKNYVKGSGDATLQQMSILDEFNGRLAQKQGVALKLLKEGKYEELKKVQAEIKKINDDLNAILNPSKPAPSAPKKEISESAAKKARQLADRRLREDLQTNRTTASSEVDRLRGLNESGELSDFDFISAKYKARTDAAVAQIERLNKANKQNSEEWKSEYASAQKEITDASSDWYKDRNRLEEEAWNKAVAAAKRAVDNIGDAEARGLKDRMNQLDLHYAEDERKIKENYRDHLITEKRQSEQLRDLKERYLNSLTQEITAAYAKQQSVIAATYDAEIKNLEKLLESSILTEKQKSEARIKIKELELEKIRKLEESDSKKKDGVAGAETKGAGLTSKKTEKEKYDENSDEFADAKAGLQLQLAEDSIAAYYELRRQYREKDLEDIEKKRDAEIAALEKTQGYELLSEEAKAAAKLAIERKYDAQAAQIKRKQAMADKAQAIFSIGIDLAKGIMRNNAAFTPAAAAPLNTLLKILAAIQIAAVAARPIPAFKDGKGLSGFDRYEGPALVGEAGRELWFNDRGVEMVDKPSIKNVGRDDVILPNSLTEKLLSDQNAFAAGNMLHRIGIAQVSSDQMTRNQSRKSSPSPSINYDAMGASVAKHILKLPFDKVEFDGNEFKRSVIDGATKRIIRNGKRRLGDRM